MSSMTKMHTTLKTNSPTKRTNSPRRFSPHSSSTFASPPPPPPPPAKQGTTTTYDANQALYDASRQNAHETRGLTIRDLMKVTVPFRNQAGHHRLQTMEYATGAGYNNGRAQPSFAPRYSSTAPSKHGQKKEFFANSYVPPGMSSTTTKTPARASPSIGDLKRMAIAKQKQLVVKQRMDRLADKRGEPRRHASKRVPTRKIQRNGGKRMFYEGSNARRPNGGSRLHSSSSPVKRSSSPRSPQSSSPPKSSTSPPSSASPPLSSTTITTSSYRYPNERVVPCVQLRQAPLVPPSRRKLAEATEERTFRKGTNRRSKEDDEEAQMVAQLRVEQILADAARGKNPNGSWGKNKPPVKFWPSSAQK